jgi:diguanylate cyclase (GGDEF)-like protein/PAS domain S-box-containing protein
MLDAFENAFANAPIGMGLIDMTGHFLQVNDALCRMTGYKRGELILLSARALSHPDDVESDASQLQGLLDGHVTSYQCEKRYVHAWGHSFWVLVTVSLVRDTQGQPLHLISQCLDISERKELERRLEHLIDHDFLTGLFNRRRFEQALAQETKSAARYGGHGALILIDLDHFKEVNDRFGHKSGDDLLKTVAAALKERIRGTDMLARLGGDEFGIILPQADEHQAQVVAEEIVKTLRRQAAMLGEALIPITASVGVALFEGDTEVEVLECADLAMYEAKEAGRNGYALYKSQKNTPPRASSRLMEAKRVRDALDHDRLVLYCQPILNLQNNQVSQYELLVRLRSEQGEMLLPSAFLYVAERFGTILALDSWVVQQAVALIIEQERAGHAITLNVNVSGKSIGNGQLVSLIDRALDETGADPTRLVFELTETAAIGNIEHAKTFTSHLRNRGCQFALDDFGTGFGSFYYLKHLAFDYLKIDGDFIRGLSANKTDQLVVEAIVGIAQGMGKKTVAEFVSDRETTHRLRQSGIDYAQGYHIGMPQPVSDAFAQL